MKIYRILTIPLMALCLYSCAGSGQDEPDVPSPNPSEPQGRGISFGGNSGTWQDAPTTRANETGLEKISKSFKVWGYKTTEGNNTSGYDHYQNVMDGYLVNWTQQTANTTSSNTADWEYVGILNDQLNTNQTIKYWDYSATSYRFFAYSIPTTAGTPISAPDFSEPQATEGSTNLHASFSIPFTYDEDATNVSTPYISDLWLSDNQNFENRKYGECVKLTFAPIITKVRFKFNYQADTQVSITNISFRNINDAASPTSGNIIITYPITGMDTQASYIWETTGAETETINFTIPYEEDGDKNHQTTTRKKWYFVPPLGDSKTTQQSAYVITAEINGKKATATVPAEFMQWKAGYQYTYIFKITEAGTNIAFTNMQVEKWVETTVQNNGGTEGW